MKNAVVKIWINGQNKSPERITSIEILFLLFVLIAALWTRIPQLDRGLELDEIDTAYYAIQTSSLAQMLSSSLSFNNHIGYSLAARVSQHIFGKSEWAFRLPAFLYGLASIYVFWVFSRSYVGPFAAAIATLLFTQSPVQILSSVTGRGYSGMILLTLLSSFFYLKLLRTPSRLYAILFSLVGFLAIYTHLYSVFTILIQILHLTYLYTDQRRRKLHPPMIASNSLRHLFFSFAAITTLSIICYIPALGNLFHDLVVKGRSTFDPAFPFAVLEYLSGNNGVLVTLIVFGIAAIGLHSFSKSHSREVSYFVPLLILPMLGMWLARPLDLYPRFFSYWLPYYLLLFTIGLKTIWQMMAGGWPEFVQFFASLSILAVTVLVLYNWWIGWPAGLRHDSFREASKAIRAGADDSIVFCAIGGDVEVFNYYFDKPLVVPTSMVDFLNLIKSHSQVRCLYYQASWESPEHTQIAQYLEKHGSWSRIGNTLLLEYQK